jgi:AcrR family transcriptional regulator
MEELSTRERIKATALNRFLKVGYKNTSLNDIAGYVGISKPAIYHHFKSKEELFFEVFWDFVDLLETFFQETLRQAKSVQSMIQGMYGSMEDVQKYFLQLDGFEPDESEISLLTLLMEGINLFPKIKERFQVLYRRMLHQMEGLIRTAQRNGEIRDDVDAEMLALHLSASYEGSMLLGMIGIPSTNKQIGQRLSEMLIMLVR